MTETSYQPSTTEYLTAYIVRDSNSRRFLKEPVYTGRKKNIWGKLKESTLFDSLKSARACAHNINSRRPKGYSAYKAEVRTITIAISKQQ